MFYENFFGRDKHQKHHTNLQESRSLVETNKAVYVALTKRFTMDRLWKEQDTSHGTQPTDKREISVNDSKNPTVTCQFCQQALNFMNLGS